MIFTFPLEVTLKVLEAVDEPITVKSYAKSFTCIGKQHSAYDETAKESVIAMTMIIEPKTLNVLFKCNSSLHFNRHKYVAHHIYESTIEYSTILIYINVFLCKKPDD